MDTLNRENKAHLVSKARDRSGVSLGHFAALPHII